MHRLVALVLTLFVAAPVWAQPDEAQTFDTMTLPRPDPEAGPTRVDVGIYVVDISKVDSVDQSFTADFAIRLSWNDPRLASETAGRRVYALSDIWNPRPTILNKRRIWTSWPKQLYVDSAGNVLFRQRYFGTMTARLDLHDFPFDHNTLKIEIISTEYGSDAVNFVLDEKLTGRSETFSVVNASVDEGRATVGSFHFAPAGMDMAQIKYEFVTSRYTSYFVWKVILPLVIIVMMSWLVFWIEPAQFGPTLGLSATAVLTLIAYRFLLGNLVPRVSYLTRLDLFILGATILVFMGMVEAVASAKVATRNEQWARRLDRVSRVLFPASFILVAYIAFRP